MSDETHVGLRILQRAAPFVALCTSVIGCTSPSAERTAAESPTVVITEEVQWPKKSAGEIRRLVRDANQGNGEAAWTLARYYDSIAPNVKRAKQFGEMAIKLEYPPALYRVAFREWEIDPKPDLDRIEKYARRALQLGISEAQDLIDEIDAARRSGEIPKRTKIRWVE